VKCSVIEFISGSSFPRRPYLPGWRTIIESDTFPKGLDENVVRGISAKKHEPEWMLEFRLKAFRKWLTMSEPAWSDNDYPTINYQVSHSPRKSGITKSGPPAPVVVFIAVCSSRS
jgi:hypothetical protein